MLYYTAVCENTFGQSPPFTLFVEDDDGGALAWNQRLQRWQYDPARVGEFTSDERNWERISPVDRAAAEVFARQLAVSPEADSELPSAEWIRELFARAVG